MGEMADLTADAWDVFSAYHEDDIYEYGEEGDYPFSGGRGVTKVLVKVTNQTEKAYLATCLTRGETGDYKVLGSHWFPKSRCQLEESDSWISQLTVPNWLVGKIEFLKNYHQEDD